MARLPEMFIEVVTFVDDLRTCEEDALLALIIGDSVSLCIRRVEEPSPHSE